jgi:hypothetical protein
MFRAAVLRSRQPQDRGKGQGSALSGLCCSTAAKGTVAHCVYPGICACIETCCGVCLLSSCSCQLSKPWLGVFVVLLGKHHGPMHRFVLRTTWVAPWRRCCVAAQFVHLCSHHPISGYLPALILLHLSPPSPSALLLLLPCAFPLAYP